MSYFLDNRQRGIGSWLDDAIRQQSVNAGVDPKDLPPSATQRCVEQGNSIAAPLFNKALKLQQEWHPTGYYTPEQVQKIVGETLKVMSSANDKLREAHYSTSDARQERDIQLKSVQRRMQESLRFRDFVASAQASGKKFIDAPDLKKWVVGSLVEASNSLVVAGALECNTPWLVSAVEWMQPKFDALIGDVGKIAGAAFELVNMTADLIAKLPSTISSVWNYALLGGGIAFGIWAFLKIKKKK